MNAPPAPEAIAHGEKNRRVILALMPFGDVASADLPMSRLLRLSLFQVSVGLSSVLLTGTLNRVMIVELGMPGWLVALMVSLPLVFAPLRALIGFKSDTHVSAFGWKRGIYIWFGSILQFGGLAVMPFALLILAGSGEGPVEIGFAGAAFGFLMIGAGMHTTQTAGLALATDLAPEHLRPRVVTMLYVMLLVGVLISALILSRILVDFTNLRLIQVIQGAAVITIVFNVIALWKQEGRPISSDRLRVSSEHAVDSAQTDSERPKRTFEESWRLIIANAEATRLLTAVGLGAAAFSMQDVLLEPFGGQILRQSVGDTTLLTAMWAAGMLLGFLLAARSLSRGGEAHRIAGYGAVAGIAAFSAVSLSAPLHAVGLFQAGAFGIGLGAGLFSVGTLTAAMALTKEGLSGLAIGAWGAVQATAAGVGIALAGALRDGISGFAAGGGLGAALQSPAVGYLAVYCLEIVLLFATVVVIGPLARHSSEPGTTGDAPFGLAEFPT